MKTKEIQIRKKLYEKIKEKAFGTGYYTKERFDALIEEMIEAIIKEIRK